MYIDCSLSEIDHRGFINRLKSEIRNNAAKYETQSSVNWPINDDYSGSNDVDVSMLGSGPSMTPSQNSMWSQPPFMSNQIYPPMNANMQPNLTDPPMNLPMNPPNSQRIPARFRIQIPPWYRRSNQIPSWFRRVQPGWHEVSNELRPMNQPGNQFYQNPGGPGTLVVPNQPGRNQTVNNNGIVPHANQRPYKPNPGWRAELPALNAAEVNHVLNAEWKWTC